MSTETSDLISKIILILFGWLLGLLAPAIVDNIRKNRDAKEVKNAIKVELIELQHRLALSAYYLDMQYDELDKKHILLLKNIVDRYEGSNQRQSIKDLIDKLSVASDEELKAASVVFRAEPNEASLLKKYPIPFIDSKMSSLAWVDKKFRRQILEIKAHLNMLDEVIDDSRFFFNLTFQKISDENHKKACQSVMNGYKNYSSKAKIIVDLIEKMNVG